MSFNLDEKDSVDGIACWWLQNQHSTKYIQQEIKKYFTKYHTLKSNTISSIMEMIWKNRKDLQKIFPDPQNIDKDSYWNWWLKDGRREYDMPAINLSTPEEYETFLFDILWKNRKDLQKIFPDPQNIDKDSYWNWWLKDGRREYDMPAINLSTPEEYETFLFDILWKNRKDLQLAFPDPKGISHYSYKEWWELYGQNEYLITRQELSSNNKTYVKSKKIALIGHPTGTFGLGEDARLITESLALLGYEIDSYVANPNINASKENQIDTKSLAEYSHDYLCNIFCLPAFDMIGLAFEYGLDLFTSTYNLSVWQWELPIFPKQAEFAFYLVHKPLAISNFTAQSIEGSYGKPIETLPLPVKESNFESRNRDYFNLPDGFMFFFSFDRNSFIERKNPLGVIEAFQRAFSNDENVILVVKSMGCIPSQIWNECKRRTLYDTRIYLQENVLNKNDYLALINLSDAIISLHRAEGFGRLMAEAFLLEKPVIVSNYSGNLDYTTPENSYLIDGMIVPTYENEYLFSNHNFWFHPDIDQASHAMRDIFSDPKLAIDKARLGKKLIQENYSLKSTGKFLKTIILKIQEKDYE